LCWDTVVFDRTSQQRTKVCGAKQMEQQIHRQLDGSVDGKKKVARARIRFNNRVAKTRKECFYTLQRSLPEVSLDY